MIKSAVTLFCKRQFCKQQFRKQRKFTIVLLIGALLLFCSSIEAQQPEVEEWCLGKRIYLIPKRFVTNFEFVGNLAFSAQELRRISRMRLGAPLSCKHLDMAKESMVKAYGAKGYFSADVDIKVIPRTTASELTAQFSITEGYESLIDDVEFDSTLPEEVVSLVDEFSSRAVGLAVSKKNIAALKTEMLTALRNEGYLRASIDIEVLQDSENLEEVETAEIDMTLLLGIVPRTPVTFVFQGNEEFSSEELLEPMELSKRPIPFSSYAVATLTRRIEKLYKHHGFYFASANYEPLDTQNGRQSYLVRIHEGPRVSIERILFEGNNSVPAHELKDVLTTQTRSGFPLSLWRKGYLVSEKLDADMSTVETYYSQLGYFGTSASWRAEYNEKEQELYIVITVDERPRVLISDVSVRWTGAACRSCNNRLAEVIKHGVGISPQDSFEVAIVEAESLRLQKLVGELGYPNVKTGYRFNPASGELAFEVNPGPYVSLGKIFVSGNRYTKDKAILRELALKPGDPWRPEKVDRAEAQLYQLGIFRKVAIRPMDNVLDSEFEDVHVEIGERDTGSYGGRLEYNTEDGVGIGADIAQRNLNGMSRSLLFSFGGFFKSGDRIIDAGHSRLAYTHPRLGGTNTTLLADTFFEFSVKLIDQFSYDRIGTSVGWKVPLDDEFEVFGSYQLGLEDLFDVEPQAILGEYDSGETLYSSLNFGFLFDHRDDVFNPSRGMSSTIEASWSLSEIGSDVNLFGIDWQTVRYTPLSSSWIWIGGMHLQLRRAFDDTSIVPLSRRLFLGGRTSLRGFAQNSIGPKSNSQFVVGGDSLVSATSELKYSFTDAVQGVLFLDVGSVYLVDGGSFTGTKGDILSLRYSPGVGLRYKTPIGPIAIDYGFAIDRKKGEGFGRINIGIGSTF